MVKRRGARGGGCHASTCNLHLFHSLCRERCLFNLHTRHLSISVILSHHISSHFISLQSGESLSLSFSFASVIPSFLSERKKKNRFASLSPLLLSYWRQRHFPFLIRRHLHTPLKLTVETLIGFIKHLSQTPWLSYFFSLLLPSLSQQLSLPITPRW